MEDEPPAPLNERYHKGDTVWRIQSVVNQTQSDELVVMDTREISSVQDLVAFAKLVNSGDRAAQRAKYLLTADLDLTGVDFTPSAPTAGSWAGGSTATPPATASPACSTGRDTTIRNLTVTVKEPVVPDTPLHAACSPSSGRAASSKILRWSRPA